MGALNASVHLTQTLHQIPRPSYLLNLGCAASLQAFKVFDCIPISHVSKYLERGQVDDHSQQLFEKTFPSLELGTLAHQNLLAPARLTSVDCPLHNTVARASLNTSSDLLDMEGYALAMTAKLMGLPIHMIKCISDFGHDKGFEEILKNISSCSERLSDIYFKIFKALS
jgi:nucleoside phosphorylase